MESIENYLQYLLTQKICLATRFKDMNEIYAVCAFITEFWESPLTQVDHHLIRDYLAVLHRKGYQRTTICRRLALFVATTNIREFSIIKSDPTL